jgi:hypothetical protein
MMMRSPSSDLMLAPGATLTCLPMVAVADYRRRISDGQEASTTGDDIAFHDVFGFLPIMITPLERRGRII